MENKEVISFENIMEAFIASMKTDKAIKASDLPNIDLYMDQVTTFMDIHLAHSKRYAEDKILTKTMINNYAKNHLLPPPDKKKYTSDHLYLLIFIYYFKNILSINDIQKLLTPLSEQYFQVEDGLSLSDIYEQIYSMEAEETKRIEKDIRSLCGKSVPLFEDENLENKDYLRLFSMVCLLSFDVYRKKQLIEKLLDEFPFPEESENRKKKK